MTKHAQAASLLSMLVMLAGSAFADHQPASLPSEQQQTTMEGSGQPDVDGVRDPFWPIGYRSKSEKRIAGLVQGNEDDWLKAKAKLKIGAITKAGNRWLVWINGNICKQDDVLGVEHDGRIYRFKIKAVHMDRVDLIQLDVKTKPPQN